MHKSIAAATLAAGLALGAFAAATPATAFSASRTFVGVRITVPGSSFSAASTANGFCSRNGYSHASAYTLGRYYRNSPPPGGTAIYMSIKCRAALPLTNAAGS